MGFRDYILVITAVSTLSAFASPLRVPCKFNGYSNPYLDLKHTVNIVGNADGRGPITDLKEFLFDNEMADAGRATGKVICPGSTFGNGGEAFASIVGDDMQIQTDVHVFVDKQGRRREPLSDCTFQPRDKSSKPIKLVFEPGSYQFGTHDPYSDVNNDFASVRLSKKIPGVTPYPVDTTGRVLREAKEIIVVSGDMDRMTKKVPSNIPVGQVCNKDPKIFPENAKRGTVFITDCDMTEGGSGSLILARDPRTRQLVALGTVNTTGKPNVDWYPFDTQKGSFTKALAFEGRFLNNIIGLSETGKIVTADKGEDTKLPIVPASYSDI